MAQGITFWVAAIIALMSAIFMLWFSRGPVHSALFLVLNLMSIAVLFVDLDAQFLGVVQIIIYAGAIMVLFLFVIMLLGVQRDEVLPKPGEALVLGSSALGLALALALMYVIRNAFSETAFAGLAEANRPGNVQALGRLLFERYAFPFEVTSLLLIVAAIGAMVLGRSHDEEEEASRLQFHKGGRAP